MEPDLAFHPVTEDKMPLPPREGGRGMGMPVDPVTGRGVRPMSGDVEPCEVRLTLVSRTYNGMSGAELSLHSEDIWNMHSDGSRLLGAGERAYARMNGVIATAVWAYIVVKNALALLGSPLRPKSRDRRATPIRRTFKPKAPTVWLTKPPTQSEWNARDAKAGYDIRGTSPTWVMRRVYRHRAKRRRALEAPHERVDRLARCEACAVAPKQCFIGPPTPRHYKDVADIGMIWPPVPRPCAPKDLLPPVQKANFISEELRAALISQGMISEDMITEDMIPEDMAPETVAQANHLIDGYNYVLELFGDAATYNYLQSLTAGDAAFMDTYINAFRAFTQRGREPPA